MDRVFPQLSQRLRWPEHGQMYEFNRDREGVVAEPAASEGDHSTARVKARSDMKSRHYVGVIAPSLSVMAGLPAG